MFFFYLYRFNSLNVLTVYGLIHLKCVCCMVLVPQWPSVVFSSGRAPEQKIQLIIKISLKYSHVCRVKECKATLQMKGRLESIINVLFKISFTLKPNKKLTTRINCFHLWSAIFQIGNLYVGHLFMWTHGSTTGAEGRPENCRKPLFGGLPCLSLLSCCWAESSRTQYGKIEKNRDRSWEDIIAPRYLNIKIGNKAAKCHFWEYMFRIFVTVYKNENVSVGVAKYMNHYTYDVFFFLLMGCH